jgi:hypothetical protein
MAGRRTAEAPTGARSDDVFDYAPGWQPAKDESVVGKVVKLDRGENQWGAYPIVTLELDAGQTIGIRDSAEGESIRTELVTLPGQMLAVHGFHHVLKGALRRARPMPGQRLAVKYLGMVDRQKSEGAQFHGYQVRVLDMDTTDFWGAPSAEDMFGEDAPTSSGQFNDEPPF